MMNRSKHFIIEELVPKEVFNLIHQDILWDLFDKRLLKSIDTIKEKFNEGTMTINNWKWGGDRTQSGLRTKDSKFYSPTSQHSIGRAADCIFSDYDVDSVRTYIITHPEEFPYIKGVELGVNWLHIDVRLRDDMLLFTK